MRFERIFLIVMDSVGIGAAEDAWQYGDQGANTLGHILEKRGLHIPHLGALGLQELLPGLADSGPLIGAYGRMREISKGKDTMTGHWELMGIQVEIPFRTYPEGFPQELLQKIARHTGRGVLGNKAASGTAIIQELGEEHMATGKWIVYTSADSVLQMAAHEEVVPLEELYQACSYARSITTDGEHAVGRVIARPFIGQPGHFMRTPRRRDWALPPPRPTVMNRLEEAGLSCIALGKIADIYSGQGVTRSIPTLSNQDGVEKLLQVMDEPFRGLAFLNLVDFDSLYGHRRDPEGYGRALEEWDAHIPRVLQKMGEKDLLIITADHGNDPTYPGTDHTREHVPLLVYAPGIRPVDLGLRSTFADVGATIAHNFGLRMPEIGSSFLHELT